MKTAQQKIAIVGGGAAGFFAAIRAAEVNPQAEITIFEASSQALAKVKISGGGRCNVSNNLNDISSLVSNYPRGARELRSAFSRFSVQDTIAWFTAREVRLKTESDGRMFPVSDSSGTVIDCLQKGIRDCGVVLKMKCRVTHIAYDNTQQGFLLTINKQHSHFFDRVILTSGGNKSSFALASALGHTVVAGVPSIFTFEVADPLLTGLAGISFDAVSAQLRVAGEDFYNSQPLLITHWGLSGPVVLKLSAFAARALHATQYKGTLRVNFVPDVHEQELLEKFLQCKQHSGRSLIHKTPLLSLPKRFWQRCLALAGIADSARVADCSKKQLWALCRLLLGYEFTVQGKGVFKEEFVTAGGVDLKEVDFKSMQSKKVPGLFFAGEVLNIDGVTGGFNFQSAWTSAWIAGSSCVYIKH